MIDDISLDSYRASVSASITRSFAPWSRMPPEIWAEEIYRLPNGRRFRWSYAPYARGMFRSIFDRSVIETVSQVYSRGLKSTVALIAIGYIIDQAPRRILSLWPTIGQAEKWSKEILCGELLDTTEPLNYLGSQSGKRNGSNTILNKLFPGGLLAAFGANSPGEMRRAKGSFLYAEEIDAMDSTITDEGDQLAIFHKRGDEYPDTIKVTASYPSVRGKSRIAARLEQSDFQQWFSTCVKCGGEPFVMTRSQIDFEPGRPDTAHFHCPRCKEALSDDDRYAMAHLQGFDNWRAKNPFAGRRGFHANAMLWPHPVDRTKFPAGWLQCLAQQQVDAERSDNPRRSIMVLVNTVDAEPYDLDEDSQDPPPYQPILDGREDYATKIDGVEKIVVPERALVLTAMTDLHGNRLEIEWRAWAPSEESWGLGLYVLHGDTNRSEVWDQWTKHLQKTFPHASGAHMALSMAFVDGGWRSDPIASTLRRLRETNVPGVSGKVRVSKGTKDHAAVISNRWGTVNKGKGGLKGVHIGTWCAKSLIYDRLRWHSATEKPEVGFMHFGQLYEDEFIRQAVSERPGFEVVDGKTVESFKNPDGNRNEGLDLLVGNLAAFRYLKNGLDFEAIRRELAEDAEDAERQKRGPVAPAAKTGQVPPTSHGRGGFSTGWRV